MHLLTDRLPLERIDSMKCLSVLRGRAGRAGLAAISLLAFPPTGLTHGGVSMDDDMCKLRLGPYYMHFAGYQVRPGFPDTEFCEDIPSTGRTIIVMDAIDQPLRSIPVKVQILTDGGDASAPPVVEIPPKVYRSGSISLEHTFERPGNFVGLVTGGEHDEYTSRFPFSVGVPRRPYGFYSLLAIVVLTAAGLYWYTVPRRARASQP